MLVREIVNKAIYLSGLSSRVLDEPQPEYSADGLRWLNGFLAELGMTGREIPFITTYVFNAVVGQQTYFVPGLIDTDSVTFELGKVRYSMERVFNNNFYATARVNSVNSLMYKYYVQRLPNGSNIDFYFFPSQNFPIHVRGRFSYPPLTYDTQMDTIVDGGTQDFFIYKIAQRLCGYYGQMFSDANNAELARLEDYVRNMNAPDTTFQARMILCRNDLLNWGQINFGRGWSA